MQEMGVQCVPAGSGQSDKFDAGCVKEALESIFYYSEVD